jgi:hypothetical protein
MGLLNAFKENKRKRVELKVEQKWEIIEYRKKFPNLSQVQLIVHFNRKFETVISKQAMSDMLKRDYEKKLEKINSVEDYNTRIREGKWPELESCLYLWHCEMERHNLPISDSLLETKSSEFADMLGIIFKHSSGWINNFKKWYKN